MRVITFEIHAHAYFNIWNTCIHIAVLCVFKWARKLDKMSKFCEKLTRYYIMSLDFFLCPDNK